MDSSLSAEVDLEAKAAEKELLGLRVAHPDLVIQLVSMKRPLSERAVRMIAAQTLRAREKGSLLAAKPEVDLLLRLAGTNQITLALKAIGYKAQGRKLLVAAGAGDHLEALRKGLERNPIYSIRKASEERDDDDLSAVEAAALLGARA
jgi:tRNA threonylcarbamoyladenosine modification (KEOPS) complex Cgi121 subunit